LELNASITLKNYWNIFAYGTFRGNNISTSLLRGGPMMQLPGNENFSIGFSTDYRKKLEIGVHFNGGKGFDNNSKNFNTELNLTYKPTDYLTVTLSPEYSKSFTELQYVTRSDYNNGERYIFASIDRKTVSASLRVNFNLSPDLTLQYWGQPFVATGKYYDHKFIVDPVADIYKDRFWTYSDAQKTFDGEQYNIDENLNGTIDYNFEKTDFNVQEFLSNLVLRWEYNPGSTVYLVWSQTRSYSNDTGNLDYFNDLGDLFDSDNNEPHNVFLIKFSYRFGLK
jgi:hypothetical protein